MFDIGFSEFVLIGVVALIVLGPERLPGAARTVGALLRRARNSWANVRNEVERELAAEELKRSMRDTVASVDPSEELRSTAEELRNTTSEVDRKLDERS
ncbi:sec-independent protein translocase protein TatB [Tahibacter aquaticus]|jgi:sec-independent protein translocase protein TatB|uniref:Sec-independent protein translocase protein TatB n=1 Tax=Tahibacter aquaticus TaxID=520092 RepID=A0A4V3DLB4_9GAMM|nr:Sec-independent protein translocase protein TatB [Tahibacter aquaticus]TDR38258.1 sec-independent protein translocase protein TatB [Tahibacter aquaticus]